MTKLSALYHPNFEEKGYCHTYTQKLEWYVPKY